MRKNLDLSDYTGYLLKICYPLKVFPDYDNRIMRL
jgi:hypothetical protein